MPFRATEAQARALFAAFGAAGLLRLPAVVVVTCEKTGRGTAVSGSAPSITSPARLSDPAEPVRGVETTLPDHIPPNALVATGH